MLSFATSTAPELLTTAAVLRPLLRRASRHHVDVLVVGALDQPVRTARSYSRRAHCTACSARAAETIVAA